MKPREIKSGQAYRLRRFAFTGFGTREAGDDVCYVTEIRQATKTTRDVHVEWLAGHASFRIIPYSQFLNAVHSEEPRAIQ